MGMRRESSFCERRTRREPVLNLNRNPRHKTLNPKPPFASAGRAEKRSARRSERQRAAGLRSIPRRSLPVARAPQTGCPSMCVEVHNVIFFFVCDMQWSVDFCVGAQAVERRGGKKGKCRSWRY